MFPTKARIVQHFSVKTITTCIKLTLELSLMVTYYRPHNVWATVEVHTLIIKCLYIFVNIYKAHINRFVVSPFVESQYNILNGFSMWFKVILTRTSVSRLNITYIRPAVPAVQDKQRTKPIMRLHFVNTLHELMALRILCRISV